MANYGKDTIGASNEAISANNKRFCKFTSPAGISDIDSITAYLDRSGAGGGYAIDGAIYTDNAGAPDALVANSAIEISSNIARNSPNWYTGTYVTKPTLSPNTPYWLGILATKASITYFDTGASNQEAMNADTLPFDNPFGSPTYHAHAMSIYVSYTPGSTDRQGEISWAELETPNAPRIAEVSWAEIETPNAPRAGEVSWAEVEVPNAPRQGEVSWAEVEVPDVAGVKAEVSWAEVEVPEAPRIAEVSWAEIETPNAPRQAEISWGEVEVPTAPRAAEVSWGELEVPNAPPSYTTYGGAFLWTAANWGSVNVYSEVYIRATTGTVYARLIDTDDNVLNGSEVNTALTTFQRLRSNALTLTNGKMYRHQFGKASGNAGEFLEARLIIIPI